ncbi:MAG: hypothetical protein GEU75_02595 [Dehalococcoidia bacterium]|nr:hypothetical protein [Dehalococcoidia bacterium]
MRWSTRAIAKLPDPREALGFGAHWGLADQALISSGNFATTLALARTLTPAHFGEFLIGYTTILLANGLQLSLITQPMNVLGAKLAGEEYKRYVGSLLTAQAMFSAACVGALIILAGASYAGGWDQALILLAAAPFMVCWQFQEFFRRVLYTEERVRQAFINDLACYACQLGLLGILWYSDVLSAEAAFYAMAASAALAALLGWAWTRQSMKLGLQLEHVRSSWGYGKWLVGTNLAQWTTGYSYRYLVALIVGPMATASLVAAEVFLRPLASFYVFLETILPIRFAKARAFLTDASSQEPVRQVFKLTVVPVAVYCLLTAAFPHEILNVLYGTKYQDASTLVRLLAVFYGLYYVNTLLIAVLKERESTRSIFLATITAAIVTIPLGLALILTLGKEGAVLAVIVHSILFGASAWRFITRVPILQTTSIGVTANHE